ncbi:hypothetical protein ONE63_008597 [Megalurothrips usitatus]|uniref:Uncharacterized protein n=1 Tax=Megalurothrips usitatus TaxID=439358 RepID=A0AAV7XUA8_9NEOP|nr:hypothetical protein ONE63_008597 [Megalurothrips usitatus]
MRPAVLALAVLLCVAAAAASKGSGTACSKAADCKKHCGPAGGQCVKKHCQCARKPGHTTKAKTTTTATTGAADEATTAAAGEATEAGATAGRAAGEDAPVVTEAPAAETPPAE